MFLRILVIALVAALPAPAQEAERGKASWYGDKFHGKKTASGERFDKNELTAAHPTLPLGTVVEVVDPKTGRAVEVEVNDRMPKRHGRSIDLSERAAEELGIKRAGVAEVVIKPVERESTAELKESLP